MEGRLQVAGYDIVATILKCATTDAAAFHSYEYFHPSSPGSRAT